MSLLTCSCLINKGRCLFRAHFRLRLLLECCLTGSIGLSLCLAPVAKSLWRLLCLILGVTCECNWRLCLGRRIACLWGMLGTLLWSRLAQAWSILTSHPNRWRSEHGQSSPMKHSVSLRFLKTPNWSRLEPRWMLQISLSAASPRRSFQLRFPMAWWLIFSSATTLRTLILCKPVQQFQRRSFIDSTQGMSTWTWPHQYTLMESGLKLARHGSSFKRHW